MNDTDPAKRIIVARNRTATYNMLLVNIRFWFSQLQQPALKLLSIPDRFVDNFINHNFFSFLPADRWTVQVICNMMEWLNGTESSVVVRSCVQVACSLSIGGCLLIFAAYLLCTHIRTVSRQLLIYLTMADLLTASGANAKPRAMQAYFVAFL